MFPCTKCGLCCQNISNIPELKDFDLGNGICKHFNLITNSCKIYSTRPLICKIDEMYEKKYYEEFTRKNFYILNAKACNSMQEIYKLEEKYRISINELGE